MRAKAPQTSRPLRRRGVMPLLELEPVVDPQQVGFDSPHSAREGRPSVSRAPPTWSARQPRQVHPPGCASSANTAAFKRSPLPPPDGSPPGLELNDPVERPRVNPGGALSDSRLPTSAGAYWPRAVSVEKFHWTGFLKLIPRNLNAADGSLRAPKNKYFLFFNQKHKKCLIF